MSEEETMKLPDGASCSMCIWFARCEQLYGATGNKTECDFYPIKFTYAWSYAYSLRVERDKLMEALTQIEKEADYEASDLHDEYAALKMEALAEQARRALGRE
jgi:hypothetical protein